MSHQQQGAEPVTRGSKSIMAQLLWHRDGAGLCQAAAGSALGISYPQQKWSVGIAATKQVQILSRSQACFIPADY